MWEHPYTVCLYPVALVGELGLTWTQVMFSQGMLVSITLVGGGAGGGAARAEASYKTKFPLCLVAITTLLKVSFYTML